MSAEFRFQGKRIFLTYPQCDVDVLGLKAFLMEKLATKHISYGVIAKENHHETDGVHRHVFLSLAEKFSTRDQSFFDYAGFHPHIEKSRAPKQCIKYCKKDGDFIEWGINPCISEKEDINKDFLEMVEKEPLWKLVQEGKISLLTYKRYRQALELYSSDRRLAEQTKATIIHWFYGKTGTGKTSTAKAFATHYFGKDSYWIHSGPIKWFDGYHGQECVIFDELREKDVTFGYLLYLLDIGRKMVEVKGGSVEFNPRHIFVCTADPPRFFFNGVSDAGTDSIQQLLRRLDEVREFTECFNWSDATDDQLRDYLGSFITTTPRDLFRIF